jgi:type III pantothenate kinase
MSATLCIDMGNTRTKAALVKDGAIAEIFIVEASVFITTINKIISTHQVQHVIVCSVLSNNFANQIIAPYILIFNHDTPLPISINYETITTLGLDRIALAVAASELYNSNATLVISMGTCITYNFINNNIFEGGAIAPGVQMRYKAMHRFTNKLPLVSNITSTPLIGKSTVSSMQSGVVNGVIAEIDHIIAAYGVQNATFNVVLTGGDLQQFAHQLKSKIFADPNFLFKGLYAILQHNLLN